MEKLTPEQRAEYREAFDLFCDGSGKDAVITSSQLKSSLTSLGLDPTDNDIKAMLHKVDLDGKYSFMSKGNVIDLLCILHNSVVLQATGQNFLDHSNYLPCAILQNMRVNILPTWL